jgi:2,3-bisphosphoglycerate-dependent phosphoglycerate mutase
MYKSLLLIFFAFLFSCKTTSYYIVRHAEKESSPGMSTSTMTTDVPLSTAGKARAEALAQLLKNDNIKHIFSTDYIRTKSTAQPLAQAINVPVEVYDPKDPQFISRLKSLKGNALIVGHSNTVDDLVNDLMGKKEISGDLPDSAYGDLFVVKRNGNKMSFEKKRFGK